MYQLRDRLGRWGVGEIYEAVHKENGEMRILKIVRGRKAEDSLIRAKLTRELQVAEKIDHPNVLKIETLEEDSGTGVFLVILPMNGETLAARLSRGVTFPAENSAALVKDVAEGLAAAHRQDFIHGELSPDSIFLKDESNVTVPLLGGFGLPPSGTKVGQPPILPLEAMPYAAPERRQSGEWSVFCDVYSICSIFAQLLIGRPPPLQGWADQPVLPDNASKESKGFLELAFRGMSKEPSQRYPTVEAFTTAVGFLLGGRDGVGTVATRRKGKVKRPTPPPPLPSGATGMPGQVHAKTILGVPAVKTGKILRKRTSGKSEGLKISVTQPRFVDPIQQPPADPPPPPPVDGSAGGLSPPGPPPGYQIDETQKRKMDLVMSEAAKDAVGIMPLEPEVFNGRTGSVPDVDSEVIRCMDTPAVVSPQRKRNFLWIFAVAGVLAVCLAVLFVWKPWKKADLERVDKSEKIAVGEREAEKTVHSEEPDRQEKDEDKSTDSTHEGITQADSGVEDVKSGADEVDGEKEDEEDLALDEDPVVSEEFDVAIEEGETAEDVKPGKEQQMSSTDQYNLYLRQGLRAMRQKRYELARRQFNRAIKIKRTSFRARSYMGQTYQRTGQHREALLWFNRALKVSPKSASTHLSIAQVYLRMKRRKEACRHFNRAFELRPNSRKYRSYVENHSCR